MVVTVLLIVACTAVYFLVQPCVDTTMLDQTANNRFTYSAAAIP